MAEYIELETAVKAFNNFDAGRADSPPFTLLTPEEFAEYLYELPTADVAPVVHGRWEPHDRAFGDNFLVCSKCQFVSEDKATRRYYHYCPNCGAKMDGGATNDA